MDESRTKLALKRACRQALRPIVRLLLKSGWTWREFADLSKAAFVEVATEDFGIRGRPTNSSRVAILTGLDRREVTRLRESPGAGSDAEAGGYLSRASRVLSGWHQDPDFLAPDGAPRELDFEGQGGFTELVRRHAGDVPATAMLKELKAAAAVVPVEAGRFRVLKRAFVPVALDGTKVRLWGTALEDLATTLEFNLSLPPNGTARFERAAITVDCDARALPAFRAFLEREGQAFLERADDWLSAHELADSQLPHRKLRLGAGVYQIQDTVSKGEGR